jgi:hypothetical protein
MGSIAELVGEFPSRERGKKNDEESKHRHVRGVCVCFAAADKPSVSLPAFV